MIEKWVQGKLLIAYLWMRSCARCGYLKDGSCKKDNWPLVRCFKMNLNHSDEKCLVLRRQVPRPTSEFISWEWVLRGWYHDDLTMRTFLSIFHTLCKQTFDSSSVHNMYVKRAQRGRGRNLQHFSSCGCWADPKTLSDAQPSTNFTTPCALCRRTWTSWGKKPTLSLFEYPAKPLKG